MVAPVTCHHKHRRARSSLHGMADRIPPYLRALSGQAMGPANPTAPGRPGPGPASDGSGSGSAASALVALGAASALAAAAAAAAAAVSAGGGAAVHAFAPSAGGGAPACACVGLKTEPPSPGPSRPTGTGGGTAPPCSVSAATTPTRSPRRPDFATRPTPRHLQPTRDLLRNGPSRSGPISWRTARTAPPPRPGR